MTVDVASLQRTGAAIRRARRAEIPPPADWAIELRARFDPDARELLDIQTGAVSAYGSVSRARRTTGGGYVDFASAPFCGDCFAVRRATGDCDACGSSQPPNLSRMSPIARHMIGEAPLR